MKRLYKRLTAAGLVVVLGMTGMAVMNTAGCGSSGEGVSSTETGETAADEAYRIAPADLTLWYADDSYADFFTEAAVRYYAKTGKKVAVQYQDTIDYLGTIYDKTMQDDAFPDVYLLPGDNLEEAYLYGLVSVGKRRVGKGSRGGDLRRARARVSAVLRCVRVYLPDGLFYRGAGIAAGNHRLFQ